MPHFRIPFSRSLFPFFPHFPPFLHFHLSGINLLMIGTHHLLPGLVVILLTSQQGSPTYGPTASVAPTIFCLTPRPPSKRWSPTSTVTPTPQPPTSPYTKTYYVTPTLSSTFHKVSSLNYLIFFKKFFKIFFGPFPGPPGLKPLFSNSPSHATYPQIFPLLSTSILRPQGSGGS